MKLYTQDPTIVSRCQEIDIVVSLVEDVSTLKEGIALLKPEQFSMALKVKCMILSQHPNFEEGVALLQQGVRGYGNFYMQGVHLLQALKTIKNDAVWMYPEMMHALISLGSNETQVSPLLEQLSQREQEVVQALEKGMSNKEIAMALKITERTVKAHLSSVYEKLEVHDRLSLAMLLRG